MELILPTIYGITGIGASGLAVMGLQSLARTCRLLDIGQQTGRWDYPCRRAHERVSTRFEATLDCTEPGDEQVSIAVEGVNISSGGLMARTMQPLAPGSVVFVHVSSFGLMGFATVRHCAPAGTSYAVGLAYNSRPVRTEPGTWEIRRVVA